MKILQICSVRDFGGGERHVADLANSLAERGHDVVAVINPGAQVARELRSLQQKNVFELPMRGAADMVAAERIASIVRENNVEIIHAHAARDYPLAAIASKRSGSPFVLTRHVLFPMRRLHKRLLGKASRVIAVSNAVSGVLRKQRIFALERIVTIHNGIDTKRFAGRDRSRDKGRICIGTVGHIAPIKGLEDLVRAAAHVVEKRSDVQFVIAGEDKSARRENEASLKQLIAHLDLAENVRLLGWQNDIAGVLADLDIFVSAARSEPFGLVMLEAMAAGVPVIATASEGALELIDDGVTGMLAPLGDPQELAAGILRAVDDASMRSRLAKNARVEVEKRFSLKGMVDATEKVYAGVLSER
jgi:glycosyltransferase involved in cell wall biosynthesis